MSERQFLVQRIGEANTDSEYRESTIMTAGELIHYIDMQDIISEDYKIYEVTKFGVITPIHYVGWQPNCLIEFANEAGEIILSGYGVDH
jgi:hypothetical protein